MERGNEFTGGQMKPPIVFHIEQFQLCLLREGTREQLIEWLKWNDPNGIYSDSACADEEIAPLTLETARETMRRQVERG